MQLTWKQQRANLPKLPARLGQKANFDLNTGLRDESLCRLPWDWEVKLTDLCFPAFVVPKRYVKGRKRNRVVACNSVAQSIIGSVRGEHDEYVFVHCRTLKVGKKPKFRPVATMNNTAWQNWHKRVGILGFRVHDMRHTVDMQLRETEVREETRDDILPHARQGMPARYSAAQVLEIQQALEQITDQKRGDHVSLAQIIREQRGVPAQKNGLRR